MSELQGRLDKAGLHAKVVYSGEVMQSLSGCGSVYYTTTSAADRHKQGLLGTFGKGCVALLCIHQFRPLSLH